MFQADTSVDVCLASARGALLVLEGKCTDSFAVTVPANGQGKVLPLGGARNPAVCWRWWILCCVLGLLSTDQR